MTLSEFSEKLFSVPTELGPTTIVIFNDEDSAEEWIAHRQDSKAIKRDYTILGFLKSDYEIEYVLKEKICNSNILQFYAVDIDTVAVVIDISEKEL